MHVTQNKWVLKVTQVTTKNSLRYSLNTSTKFSVFLSSFFFLRHKMERLRNRTQWSLGPQHHDN